MQRGTSVVYIVIISIVEQHHKQAYLKVMHLLNGQIQYTPYLAARFLFGWMVFIAAQLVDQLSVLIEKSTHIHNVHVKLLTRDNAYILLLGLHNNLSTIVD